MDADVQSALIGALVTVAVTGGLLLRRRRRRTDALFAVLATLLVIWFLATFLHGTYGPDPWLRVALATASLVPAAVIKLVAELVPMGLSRGRKLMSASYPISGIVAVAAISPLGNLPAVQIFTGTYVGFVILLASRLMMQQTDLTIGTVEYAQRRYAAIGAALVTILAILGEIPQLGAASVGHLAVMLYVFFLSQVILRDRLLDLNEFLGRMLVLGILAVLFAAIIALLVGLGTNASSRLFNAVVGVAILLTLYEPLKVRLESKLSELFFRERHRFTETLEGLRRRMQHGVIDPDQMATIVVDTLYDARRATHVAIYQLEALGQGFVLHSFRGPEPAPRVNAHAFPAVWHAIQQNRAPLLMEQLTVAEKGGQDQPTKRDLIEALHSLSADILCPFVSGETVLGFLALRDDRTPEPYATAEIAHLMKIAETAATVIWNSKLAERLRERERLAVIGAMAAGMAHEIRNPLGAIKGAAEYLDPASFAGEKGEFLQVIIDETNRLNTVVSQFLDYARPFRPKFQPTDVNDIVRKTAKLAQARKTETPVSLELHLGDAMPSIEADSEQIKQVILNLMWNAIEASAQEQQPVVITTRHLPEYGCIELRVRDHGTGIPEQDLDHIFIPFFTTKQKGTGLGLAVCQRIVLNHGGTIYPEAASGRGTEFAVRLPIRREAGSTTGSSQRHASNLNVPKPSNQAESEDRAGVIPRAGKAAGAF